MAIEIQERFQVAAPIDAVWAFVMDPNQVVTCLPGATLLEVVDERNFIGQVKVKVGAVTASYKGKIQLTSVDAAAHRVEMVAEGKETSGGTAKGSMRSTLAALPDGGTEVVAEATVDLTGRLVQVGRGMIQGVSHQIFLQFVAATKARLEVGAPVAVAASAASADTATKVPVLAPASAAVRASDDSIKILPILFRAFLDGVRRLFRRLLGSSAP